MSWLGASTSALAVVYALIGLHAVFLWGGRRREFHYALFGCVCLCMGGYAVAATVLTQTRDISVAATAQTVELTLGAFAAAFYVHFARLLVDEDGWLVTAAIYGVALGAAALGMAGLLIDHSVPLGALRWVIVEAPNDVIAQATPYAHVLEGCMAAMVLYAAYLHYVRGAGSNILRPPAFAPVLVVLAGAFDITMETMRLGLPYLSEYAFLILAAATSARFIRSGAQASADLATHTSALESSALHLQQTQEQLVRREQLAAVGELSAILAHEIRNPLAVLQNVVSGLAKKTLRDADHELLVDAMEEETERLDTLVTDLLTYVKPMDVGRRAVDVRTLLRQAVERVRAEIGDRGALRIEQGVSQEVSRCFADPELLRQAVGNLLENAIHATGEGTIRIQARLRRVRGSNVVVIEVTDNGPGMSPAVAERAREPFFTTRSEGTGLGLAIVDRVMRAHAGRMEIDSGRGHGVTVRLLLPMTRSDRVPSALPSIPPLALLPGASPEGVGA